MRQSRSKRLMGEINVVPYIDVMLVLLIIFMITAPLLTQGIQVDLPKAAAEPLDPELLRDNEPLVLSINRDGELFLNIGGDEETPVDEQTVLTRTAAVLRRNPQTPVLVKADEAVAYGRVVTGMVILQQAGAGRVHHGPGRAGGHSALNGREGGEWNSCGSIWWRRRCPCCCTGF